MAKASVGQGVGRSTAAEAYRPLYRTARWKRTRAEQLAAEPLCRTCAKAGRVTAADTVDHIIPHRGDERLFWDRANLQSLCDAKPWRCHSRIKQREETIGFSPAVGTDGFPIDQRHRANRRRT